MEGGKITALRVQKKNSRRANLYLDGEFVLGLSLEVVQDFGLHRGQVLTAAEVEALRQAEDRQRAYQAALNLLSYRPRSVAEMRRRLQRKEYGPLEIEATIERLQDLGYLDDLAFARSWVENRKTFRPRGRRALASELRRKGISYQIIDRVLDEALEPEEQAEAALRLAQKRARRMRGLDRRTFVRRLRGYLARRGFSSGLVWEVIEQVWEENERSTDE